eukprot:scaffold89748_cov15-Prasinocladus_malaysianus.AAC.1
MAEQSDALTRSMLSSSWLPLLSILRSRLPPRSPRALIDKSIVRCPSSCGLVMPIELDRIPYMFATPMLRATPANLRTDPSNLLSAYKTNALQLN